MDTNCVPLIADIFLFCYERYFMTSLSDNKQADIIDAFTTTSRGPIQTRGPSGPNVFT